MSQFEEVYAGLSSSVVILVQDGIRTNARMDVVKLDQRNRLQTFPAVRRNIQPFVGASDQKGVDFMLRETGQRLFRISSGLEEDRQISVGKEFFLKSLRNFHRVVAGEVGEQDSDASGRFPENGFCGDIRGVADLFRKLAYPGFRGRKDRPRMGENMRYGRRGDSRDFRKTAQGEWFVHNQLFLLL